jgi:hypothetical protein
MVWGASSFIILPLFSVHPFSTRLRICKLKKYVKALGLSSARSQAHTFETIAGPIAELRSMFPNAGALELRTNLWNKYDMRVSKYVTVLSSGLLSD